VACSHDVAIGSIITDNKKVLRVAAKDGFILLTDVQQAGKKRMSITDFLRGTQLNGNWKTVTE
jgi:methionyl-tRNA formyltransferase